MALAGEIMRYIGNEFVPMATKTASSSLSSVIPSAITKTGTSLATKAGTAIIDSLVPKMATSSAFPDIPIYVIDKKAGLAIKNSGVGSDVAKSSDNYSGGKLRPVRHIPINQVSNAEEVPVATLRTLFRGQKKGSDDLYYNKGDGTTGSATVGNGYYMTPNADKAEVWAGEGINPISIKANTKDILSKNELIEKTKWANDLINDEAYMSELWGKDPDMADFIENLSMGRLPEISKYLDKPFIQPDSGQREELAETIFFPDTRPELTQSIRNSLKEKSSKIRQPKVELIPQQQEFFKDSVIRDKSGMLKKMYHGSPNGEIKEFNPGSYFTENKEYADGYQNPEASSLMPGARKIKNTPKTYEV